MKFRKMVRRRALVVILTITMICQGIIPAYADTPDKHSESENIVSEEISEESIIPDEVVLASPDNAAYDSGKNEDITIEEVYEEDPLSADGLILGAPINEEDDRLIIGSEGTVLRVPDNPKDIELVYSLEDDTYIGSTYSTEIDNEYSDKSIFVQLTLTPLDPQQIAFGSREQKVKIPLSDMLELDDRIYFSIEASNEMKLTNSEVKDNWEVELSLLISDDENTELEDLTDGEMYHREGYLQSGDDAFAFADSVLFTVENIKHTSFDPYSLLVVMAPQDTWWKSEDYQRSDIDEIIFGQTPTADIKETWNADADDYGFIKCFITETIGDDSSYRTLYIARTVGNSSEIVANEDSSNMFGACGTLGDGTYDAFDNLRELEISNLNTENVEDMHSMFYSCKKLERLDLSNFDTAHVTDMSEMFSNCESLEELDLSSFDTALVTTMSGMFSSCKSLTKLDLSGFDTGNVTLMSYMFDYCTNLETIDLTGFDTSNVTSMWFMFDYCESLKTIYSNDFYIGKVELGSPMFLYCSNLVGEKGTVYEIEFGIPEYAHIDGGESNPGYFTSKKSEPEESLKYTVTFDSNGHGTAPTQQQITAGGKMEKPDNPISEGYAFEGWYKEASCENRWDFNTDVVNEDITLFAKWTNSMEIASGISGTCKWSIDGNTLIIEAIDKQDGTLDLWTDTPPWYEYRTEISDVRLLGNIHAKTCRCMFAEFNSTHIRSNTILDLSNLDTSEVTDMSGMFYACNCKGLNLRNIDTSNVTDMTAMFRGWGNEFNEELDLSSFDTSNVTNMSGMFMGGYKDLGFNATVMLDLSTFNTEKVTDMSNMFSDTYFNLSGLDLSGFNTQNVLNMSGMFYGCDSLTILNLNNFDTRNVKTMNDMFGGCSNLVTLNISSFNTNNVIDMNHMFSGCSSLKELNLKSFNTSNVGSMESMFSSCSALTILDLSTFDAGSVYDTEWMFANCTNLIKIDLSNFAENKISSTQCMFKDCCNLTDINLGSFDTSNIKNMTEMFSGCSSLTELNISSFSYRALIDKSYMFNGCANLKTIIVDKFCHDSGYSSSMFGGCTKLVGGKGTIYDEDYINGEYAHIDGGQSNPGYFTSIDTDIENDSLKIKRFITPAMSYDIYLEAGMKCYEFNYDNTLFDRCETPIEVEVSDGASWDLYSDKECLDKLDKNKPVSLTGETNVFYIKVYDDNDSITYKIIITRVLSNSITSTPVSYWSSFAYDSNKHITFDIQWGWDLFKNPLDHNCDRRTMIAALMLANGAYNDIELVYKELGFKEINRRQRGVDVGEYSYAMKEVDFEGNKKLILSITFRGTQNKLWDNIWNFEAATFLGVGFETGAASAIVDMLDYYKNYIELYGKENVLFFVTGHSLGGAEANEAAMILAQKYNPENIFAYTFNSPTTTDKSDLSVPKLFNLYNIEDIVPKAGENYGIIQLLSNGQLYGKRYGYDIPFIRDSFMEDEFRIITGGRGFNDVAPLYQSDYSTSFFESMGIALSNIYNSAAYNVNKIMLEHQPDTLLAYLLSFESITVKPSQPGAWRRISVKCPVDIEVIDSNGVSVAKIEDNQIKELKDPSLILFVHDDEKYILSSEKKDYKLKLTGTDNGEMELAVDEIDFSTGEVATSKQFDHVVLYKGKEMLGTVNEVAEKSVLQLMENGKPIKNIETNGTETPLSATYIVSFNSNGHGTAPDSQQISAGGKVSKPADPAASGYTFGGWYTESSCINQWNFSTGVVNSNITLFAKWTGNADGIIPSGGNTGSGGSGSNSGGSGGSGGGGGSISKAKTATGATYSPNWFVDASGVWKIRNSKGEIIKNAWLCDDVITANGQNVWYLLQADGSMLSAGLVQDNTGNFYSLETTHNGYFGMMRYKDGYYDCNGQQVYLKFNQKHDNSFGAVINEDGLEKLKQIYGITKYPIGNETCTYTSTF